MESQNLNIVESVEMEHKVDSRACTIDNSNTITDDDIPNNNQNNFETVENETSTDNDTWKSTEATLMSNDSHTADSSNENIASGAKSSETALIKSDADSVTNSAIEHFSSSTTETTPNTVIFNENEVNNVSSKNNAEHCNAENIDTSSPETSNANDEPNVDNGSNDAKYFDAETTETSSNLDYFNAHEAATKAETAGNSDESNAEETGINSSNDSEQPKNNTEAISYSEALTAEEPTADSSTENRLIEAEASKKDDISSDDVHNTNDTEGDSSNENVLIEAETAETSSSQLDSTKDDTQCIQSDNIETASNDNTFTAKETANADSTDQSTIIEAETNATLSIKDQIVCGTDDISDNNSNGSSGIEGKSITIPDDADVEKVLTVTDCNNDESDDIQTESMSPTEKMMDKDDNLEPSDSNDNDTIDNEYSIDNDNNDDNNEEDPIGNPLQTDDERHSMNDPDFCSIDDNDGYSNEDSCDATQDADFLEVRRIETTYEYDDDPDIDITESKFMLDEHIIPTTIEQQTDGCNADEEEVDRLNLGDALQLSEAKAFTDEENSGRKVDSPNENSVSLRIQEFCEVQMNIGEQDTDSGTITSNASRLIDINPTVIAANCNAKVLCTQCKTLTTVKYVIKDKGQPIKYICNDHCLDQFKLENPNKVVINEMTINVVTPTDTEDNKVIKAKRNCAMCSTKIDFIYNLYVTWECMDFCNTTCLGDYQETVCTLCTICKTIVPQEQKGKLVLRQGVQIYQFCSSECATNRQTNMKFCSCCYQELKSNEAKVDKCLENFCSTACQEQYKRMAQPHSSEMIRVQKEDKCCVCQSEKAITIEYETNLFCSDPCFIAYSFVNNVKASKCGTCERYTLNSILQKNTLCFDDETHNTQLHFCSQPCCYYYLHKNAAIVTCLECNTKKYNYDMIRCYYRMKKKITACSLPCLNTARAKTIDIEGNTNNGTAAEITSMETTAISLVDSSTVNNNQVIIPSAHSNQQQHVNYLSSVEMPIIRMEPEQIPTTVIYKKFIVVKPQDMPRQRNVNIMVAPKTRTKAVQVAQRIKRDKAIQTDKNDKAVLPLPVPIFVPIPMTMYSVPVPYPLPFPVPIPIPIFIPTTRNSAKGIMKEIKKIQAKTPADPYEAELLMMAEMVANDKKDDDDTDSDSNDENADSFDGNHSMGGGDVASDIDDVVSTNNVKLSSAESDLVGNAAKTNNNGGFGVVEHTFQRPPTPIDLEGALQVNTILVTPQSQTPPAQQDSTDETLLRRPPVLLRTPSSGRGRKRGSAGRNSSGESRASSAKRRRGGGIHVTGDDEINAPSIPPPPRPSSPQAAADLMEVARPDANYYLKFTFGINAWKQWIAMKNAELEKNASKTTIVKYFKTDILQMTADELNYALSLFVQEVRKPNDTEYAPDTIYYLCLGIQQYLYEKKRIDNIFCDNYYELFTDTLDRLAKKFSLIHTDSQYIVTRVEEEHLWESKQLGAHSPHVLLYTLMYFNTKHFNLTTVEEHKQLSFSHIMKHWKRNAAQTRVPSQRHVLLRFYPPQSALQANSRKKKVYEQQENEENPLRCPVKLYEFYLSKCPESVKCRNDIFYLQPERSCVPESPVWYSTTGMGQEGLEKMLRRIRMVKEINISILVS